MNLLSTYSSVVILEALSSVPLLLDDHTIY
jgi:hypothetical protein